MFTVQVRIGKQWISLRDFRDQDKAVAIAKDWGTRSKPFRVIDSLGMVAYASNKTNGVKHVEG